MSGRAGPSGKNRYAGVGVSVGGTGVAVGAGVAVAAAVGVSVTVGVSVGGGVAVSVGVVVAVDVAVAVGVSVEVAVGIGVHVGVNGAVRVSVGTTASETTGWGTEVPGLQAPIPTTLKMVTIAITDPRFLIISLNQPPS